MRKNDNSYALVCKRFLSEAGITENSNSKTYSKVSTSKDSSCKCWLLCWDWIEGHRQTKLFYVLVSKNAQSPLVFCFIIASKQ